MGASADTRRALLRSSWVLEPRPAGVVLPLLEAFHLRHRFQHCTVKNAGGAPFVVRNEDQVSLLVRAANRPLSRPRAVNGVKIRLCNLSATLVTRIEQPRERNIPVGRGEFHQDVV